MNFLNGENVLVVDLKNSLVQIEIIVGGCILNPCLIVALKMMS